MLFRLKVIVTTHGYYLECVTEGVLLSAYSGSLWKLLCIELHLCDAEYLH